MKNDLDLTTYQMFLMLLGYLTERNDGTTRKIDENTQMLISVLVELYRRADKTESEVEK